MSNSIKVPDKIQRVCLTLTNAGFQAVCVGGAIRDALMGRKPHDWDVATSAIPSAVQGLFTKTVPTGLQHGTVTVMDGGMAIEVTSFRTEGKYGDARRPDQVEFGVTLEEDLSRRDLTVNAIAYDPVNDIFHDPFNGRQDIEDRILRAVGNPVERFTEDGLRVMRAVRFSATLGFHLDPATNQALSIALPSLQKVSIERVRDELEKLMLAPAPSRALRVAFSSGIIKAVLPELHAVIGNGDTIDHMMDRVNICGLNGRMAALLSYVDDSDTLLRRLKFSNQDRERLVKLIAAGNLTVMDKSDVRRLLARAGREIGETVLELWTAHSVNALREIREDMVKMGREILDAREPLSIGELAVSGSDLIASLGMAPGKELGNALRKLLEAVFENPALNTREDLLLLAKLL